MQKNEQVIAGLFNAYQNRNAVEMASFYSADAVFKDPIFGTVQGEEISKVWQVVHSVTNDLYLHYHIIQAGSSIATANTYLTYNFKHTNRNIKISIKSHFRLANGKIVLQTDEYSMWNWMSQAYGLRGLLLGWNPFIINRARISAKNTLLSI